MTSDPFRNRDHVPDFDALVEEYKVRSAATRSALPMAANIAYGDGKAETLDLFFPVVRTPRMPVHLFIHGGYWRMFTKEDFSFIADTVTVSGAVAAVMDYDLMPAVRMERIVDQVRRATRWLIQNAGNHGGDAARLSVSGHSAGGHLASFTFTGGEQSIAPKSAFLLSGLFDLKPLQSSFLEPLIGLTNEEVRAFSPLNMLHLAGPRITIACGEEETPPFKQQAAAFRHHLATQGCEAASVILPGANHMTAVRDMGIPESTAGILLRRTIEQS